MDLFDAIFQRRSIRKFTDQAIPVDDLEKILEAARWAPNGGNRNAWRFLVIRDEAQKKLLLNYCPGISDMPAAIIMIGIEPYQRKVTDPARLVLMADAAVAAENICLAAHALGIGSCMVASFADLAIRELLDIPETVTPHLLVTLGYPAEEPEPPPRRPLREVAFLDEYGKGWGDG